MIAFDYLQLIFTELPFCAQAAVHLCNCLPVCADGLIRKILECAPEIAPEIASLIASEIASLIAPEIASLIAPEIASLIAPEIAPEIVPGCRPDVRGWHADCPSSSGASSGASVPRSRYECR